MRCFLLAVLLSIPTIRTALAQTSSFVLDDLNPDDFNLNFEEYDQSTAVFCAQLSNLAYYDLAEVDIRIEALRARHPENTIRYKFINQSNTEYPLSKAQINSGEKRSKLTKSNTDTQLILFGTKKFIVIAFRGTTGMKDIKTDLKYFDHEINPEERIAEYRDLPSGHKGFRESIYSLINQQHLFKQLKAFIGQYTDDPTNFPVYLTGHSLGGALAIMAIKPLQYNQEFKFGGAYTFAPALAVSCSNKDKFENEKALIHNVVNHTDIVPRLNFRHYRLIGNFYRLSKYEPNHCIEDDGALYHEEVRFVKMLAKEDLRFMNSVLGYHRLDRYIERLKLTLNSNKEVKARGFDTNCLTKNMPVVEYECKYGVR